MKRQRLVVMFAVVVSLPGLARADDVYTWTGAMSDDWMTAGNWSPATVPSDGALGGDADCNIGSTAPLRWPVLDTGDVPYHIDDLWIGNGSGLSGELLVQGGVRLECGDRIGMCYTGGSVYAKLTVRGPGTTVVSIKSLELGADGTVVIDVDGGKLEIGEVGKPRWNMIVAEGAHSDVTIYIRNGGVLEHHGDKALDNRGGLIVGEGKALIDIGSDNGLGGGTLRLKNDVTELVRSLCNEGVIVADGGTRDVKIGLSDGYTVVTASLLTTRLNPSPIDGSTVTAGPIELQWTLPEPNVPGGIVTCDVYFGTNPNVEANPKVVVRQAVESVPVTLAPLTTYYWALDLYDSGVGTTDPFYLSPIYTFNTLNTAPVVDAGDDVATWLDNGQRVVQLDGVVADEDGGPATLLWTVMTEPNESNPAQISNPLVANPTVTMKEPGSYTLQLEADDGEYTTADIVNIVLYADACAHAQHQEGYEPLAGDTNDDCRVDYRDLVNLGLSWLEENFSTE